MELLVLLKSEFQMAVVSCTVALEVGLKQQVWGLEEALMEIKQATEHEILNTQICNEFSSILCVLYDSSFCCELLRMLTASFFSAWFVYMCDCVREAWRAFVLPACRDVFLCLRSPVCACVNGVVFISSLWKCMCLVNCLWLRFACVCHWCLQRGAAGAHSTRLRGTAAQRPPSPPRYQPMFKQLCC